MTDLRYSRIEWDKLVTAAQKANAAGNQAECLRLLDEAEAAKLRRDTGDRRRNDDKEQK